MAFFPILIKSCFTHSRSDTPFDSPQITMVQTISQVIGSPDFSIFRLVNDETSRSQVPFGTLSIIIWIIFGETISVLFITFLMSFVSRKNNNL